MSHMASRKGLRSFVQVHMRTDGDVAAAGVKNIKEIAGGTLFDDDFARGKLFLRGAVCLCSVQATEVL